MFSKNDKIKVITPIFGNDNIVGEIGTIKDISYNNGLVAYKLDNVNSSGLMSLNVFEKYFEKYEEEEPQKVAITVNADYIGWIIENSEFHIDTVFDKCTVVSCRLPNGFVIVESSACVDPDNYNEDMGIEICTNKIVDKIWELEGYALQNRIWMNVAELEECECCAECCCDEIDECLDTDLDCDDCEDHDCPFNTNN